MCSTYSNSSILCQVKVQRVPNLPQQDGREGGQILQGQILFNTRLKSENLWILPWKPPVKQNPCDAGIYDFKSFINKKILWVAMKLAETVPYIKTWKWENCKQWDLKKMGSSYQKHLPPFGANARAGKHYRSRQFEPGKIYQGRETLGKFQVSEFKIWRWQCNKRTSFSMFRH